MINRTHIIFVALILHRHDHYISGQRSELLFRCSDELKPIDESGDIFQSNLYVGNLPLSMSEEGLHALFSPFGDIVRCKLGRNHLSGLPAGYGFVQFDSAENADKAITAMHGRAIDNRVLRVSIANPPAVVRPRTNLYICRLPPTFTAVQLHSMFSEFGTIVGSRILLNPHGDSRGVAFVRYDNQEEAEHAIEALNGAVPQEGEVPIFVKFAREKSVGHHDSLEDQRNGGARRSAYHNANGFARNNTSASMQAQLFRSSPVGFVPASYSHFSQAPVDQMPSHFMPVYPQQYLAGPGVTFGVPPHASPSFRSSPMNLNNLLTFKPKTNLYVSGLPASFGKQDLEFLFEKHGRIIGSRILCHADTGQSRGIGFVRFDNPQSPLDAICALNGFKPTDSSQPLHVKFARDNDRSVPAHRNVNLVAAPPASLQGVPAHTTHPLMMMQASLQPQMHLNGSTLTYGYASAPTSSNSVAPVLNSGTNMTFLSMPVPLQSRNAASAFTSSVGGGLNENGPPNVAILHQTSQANRSIDNAAISSPPDPPPSHPHAGFNGNNSGGVVFFHQGPPPPPPPVSAHAGSPKLVAVEAPEHTYLLQHPQPWAALSN